MSDVSKSGGLLELAIFTGAALMANESLYYVTKPKPPYTYPFDKDIVYLYQFRRSPLIPSLSSCCLSLETWLRFAKIKYENVEARWIRSKKEEILPFVEFNGIEQSGSNDVIVWLAKNLQVTDLEASVETDDTRNMENMADKLMWCYNYFRYVDNKDFLSEKYLGKNSPTIPYCMPWCAVPLTQQMFECCYEEYSGDYLPENAYFSLENLADRGRMAEYCSKYVQENKLSKIEEFKDFKLKTDYTAKGMSYICQLSEILGTKKYFFGNKPSSSDCIAFGVLAQILYVPMENPLKDSILTVYKNLAEFCDEIKKSFWPDWEKCIETGRMNTHCDYVDDD